MTRRRDLSSPDPRQERLTEKSVAPRAHHRDDGPVDLNTIVPAVGALWRLDTTGWQVVVLGQAATVRLPAADAVLHVSRAEVTSQRIRALHAARARLAAAGIPVVGLVPSAAGRNWEHVEGRVVEVEHHVHHDGRMNTWALLEEGAALLARVHDAWVDLDLGSGAERCTWANWIAASDVLDGCERAATQLASWGLDQLGEHVVRLAELTAEQVALPEQVVHGDFWDDNVYVRGDRLVAVTDFDFLGRRPRIDDLALLLYFADEQPYFDGSGPRSESDRLADLTPLVRAYAGQLAVPLDPTEITALPVALARQPLWTYGKWVLDHPDQSRARHDAVATAPAVPRALEIMDHAERWVEAFTIATYPTS